jgi:hypothetical protein
MHGLEKVTQNSMCGLYQFMSASNFTLWLMTAYAGQPKYTVFSALQSVNTT